MPNEVTLTFSLEGLSALAEMALAPKSQDRLEYLLRRSNSSQLSEDEQHELDVLIGRIDELNLAKAQAAVALNSYQSSE
jgi:hypothetical protein